MENVKKHILEFETEKGLFKVATDDLNELGNVEWFRRFIGVEAAQRVVALEDIPESKPVADYKKVQDQIGLREITFTPPKPDPLSILPSQMNDATWNGMTAQQREEWIRKYNS